MSYQVIILPTVELDLEEILDYYMQVSPVFAQELLERFSVRCQELSQFPERGRVVPELLQFHIMEYREVIEQHWRIFYKKQKDVVLVLAIIDSRRNVQDILLTKLQRKLH